MDEMTATPQAQPNATPVEAHNPDARRDATMAAALIEWGVWTQEQADAALRSEDPADAQSAEAVAQTGAAMQVPEGQDELTVQAFAGPQSAQSYRFETPPAGVEVSLEQEASFRDFFHAEGVPQALAGEIGRLWNKACANPPDEQALEQSRQAGMAALSKLWGADRDKNLAIAQREIARMAKAKPEIISMLEQSGLGNSPWLTATVFNVVAAKGRV